MRLFAIKTGFANTVCLVHLSSYPGGAEILLPEIIEGFPGKEFISFVIRPDTCSSLSVYNGLKHKVLHGSASNIVAGWKLFRFARKEKKAVFHVYNIGSFFLFIIRLAGVRKLIYAIHGTVYWKNNKQKFIRKIFWWLAINRKEYRFTSNSEFSRKVFLDKIDPKVKIELLYNPISLKKFNSIDRKITDPNKIKKIIYAGRLAAGKGLENWIKLAVAIHNENQWIQFEIFGEGPLMPMLQEIIRNHEVMDYISLKGHISDIGEVYRNADLLLFLSEYESFGNVVVESIFCGTPVIASDIPSMKEIFRNYPEFLISTEGDQIQIVIQKLKEYSELKKLCIKAGYEFRFRFSTEQHIAKLNQLYAEFNS